MHATLPLLPPVATDVDDPLSHLTSLLLNVHYTTPYSTYIHHPLYYPCNPKVPNPLNGTGLISTSLELFEGQETTILFLQNDYGSTYKDPTTEDQDQYQLVQVRWPSVK